MKKVWFFVFLTAGLIFFDRLFKSVAFFLDNGQIITLFPNYFYFQWAANQGIAFSLPVSGWWLSGLIILVLIVLLVWLIREVSAGISMEKIFFLFLLIGGAASNLADRWRNDYVVDYLYLRYFTVFNIADAMIVAGAFGLLIWQWRRGRGQKKSAG